MPRPLLVLCASLIACSSSMSPEPTAVNFRLVAGACSSIVPVALSIDSALVATDTFRIDVPNEHLQSRDFAVSAGSHTLAAHLVGTAAFAWPSRTLTVSAGTVVTDSLPFTCS